MNVLSIGAAYGKIAAVLQRASCTRVSTARTPRWWAGRGRRSCGCAAAFGGWPPKDSKNVAATPIAPELAGFLWAEMAAERCLLSNGHR